VIVVEENAIRGVYIRNAKVITAIAEDVGLSLEHQFSGTLPPTAGVFHHQTKSLEREYAEECVEKSSSPLESRALFPDRCPTTIVTGASEALVRCLRSRGVGVF
jgi:hypothetical protein